MGNSSWSSSAYTTLSNTYAKQSTTQIFKSKATAKDMSPKDVKFRESRDSVEHPNSLAIMVMLDETGSMGYIPENLIKNKLGTLMETLIKNGVEDSHVLFGGIGDHYTDDSSLQVGQFEAGTKELDEWLTKIYLEGGGGGNGGESYHLAWLFAARHTSIDCFEKRGKKGFLFTIGDEEVHKVIESRKIKEILGYDLGEDISSEQLLSEAQKMYHVYHLLISETGSGRESLRSGRWKKLLGENCLVVEDSDKVAEIIASTVAVVNGADIQDVVKDFDDHTAKLVTKALAKVDSNLTTQNNGVITL